MVGVSVRFMGKSPNCQNVLQPRPTLCGPKSVSQCLSWDGMEDSHLARGELTVVLALRTVARTNTHAKGSRSCPTTILTAHQDRKATRTSTPTGRSSRGCWNTVLKLATPRSRSILRRGAILKVQSSKRRTTAPILDTLCSCSPVGGLATTRCASTGLPVRGSLATQAGSWRSYVWVTGSRDLLRSPSLPQTPKTPIPVWPGAFRSDWSIARTHVKQRGSSCLHRSNLGHLRGEVRR